MGNIRITKQDYINYTKAHRKAFKEVERGLLGKNTWRSFFHDLDKLILYRFLDVETVSKIHRKFAWHHGRAKSKNDFIEQIIDWQCAGRTKPDKPLNAYQTLMKYREDEADIYIPLMFQLGILTPERKMLEPDGTYSDLSLNNVRIKDFETGEWKTVNL